MAAGTEVVHFVCVDHVPAPLCWRFVGEGGGEAGLIIRNQSQIPSELSYIEHGFFLGVLIVKVAAASIRLDSGIR